MINMTNLVIKIITLSGQIALIKKDRDPEDEALKEVRDEEGLHQGVQNFEGSDLTNESFRL